MIYALTSLSSTAEKDDSVESEMCFDKASREQRLESKVEETTANTRFRAKPGELMRVVPKVLRRE